METELPVTTYRSDYRKPDFLITSSELDIQLDFEVCQVEAIHRVCRNSPDAVDLKLDCEFISVDSVCIDGKTLDRGQYDISEHHLTVFNVPDNFDLKIWNTVDPSRNTELMGLYKSKDMLCTQCEAEGYRRITPGIDRPDNLAQYRVRLSADKTLFPVLLCNGNLIDQGDLEFGRHFALWDDPFPKPAYLFAIVAGKLSCLEDHFRTMDGRDVTLHIFARDNDIDKCGHAMQSLKNSMKWDEQVYGRIYDLDLFNVVAVDDFNMGAMENKSLNIFNTKYVLADMKMATDADFQHVESVIGHEYFHNWSGNRVTCRDWFQLSLKEGFTVFRDQEFSADMGSRAAKRIEVVSVLRSHQFKEDAGPMAHPVRPDSYQTINNFYTATVYEKGAEVVRMIHTLLGAELFRQGADHYFETFDGQAVTIEQFVSSMEKVSDRNLTQFRNWYDQAGTPVVSAKSRYHAGSREFELTLAQRCPDTPGQTDKQPFVIPVKTALFSESGEKLDLGYGEREQVLCLDKFEQTYRFSNIESRPVPSLLRGFSAPVELEPNLSDQDLKVLLDHDDDPFNRWDSGQRFYLKDLLDNLDRYYNGYDLQFSPELTESFDAALTSHDQDPTFTALLLTLPTISYLSEQVSPIDPQAIQMLHRGMKIFLTMSSEAELFRIYHKCQSLNNGSPLTNEIKARDLRDRCLGYLATLNTEQTHALCIEQLNTAKCMTDSAKAMTLICGSTCPQKEQILADYYQQWKDEPLVVDNWLRAQAGVVDPDTLEQVRALTRHPGFDYMNPNKVYSLILGFTHGNPGCFHAEDGSGYEFLLEWIAKLDPVNPQVCARLVSVLNNWRKYKPVLKDRMHDVLNSILKMDGLSIDVREIVNKNLG